MVREAKDSQRRKLWAVTFTSEVFQTLVDDQTTVYLSSTPSNLVDASSRAAAAKCALGAEVILDLDSGSRLHEATTVFFFLPFSSFSDC